MPWLLRSKKEKDVNGVRLFWSNLLGWTTERRATRFTAKERDKNLHAALAWDATWVLTEGK